MDLVRRVEGDDAGVYQCVVEAGEGLTLTRNFTIVIYSMLFSVFYYLLSYHCPSLPSFLATTGDNSSAFLRFSTITIEDRSQTLDLFNTWVRETSLI